MKEPEYIKKIHQVREKMAEESNYSIAKFAKTIRQAEQKNQKLPIAKHKS